MNIRKFWQTAETVAEDAWEAFAGDAPGFVRALADEVTALRSTIEQLYQDVHGGQLAEPPFPVTQGTATQVPPVTVPTGAPSGGDAPAAGAGAGFGA